MNNHDKEKKSWQEPTLEEYNFDVVQGGATMASAEFVMGAVTYMP